VRHCGKVERFRRAGRHVALIERLEELLDSLIGSRKLLEPVSQVVVAVVNRLIDNDARLVRAGVVQVGVGVGQLGWSVSVGRFETAAAIHTKP
jgi:hypothetical protein